MSRRFVPQLTPLESREVPAVFAAAATDGTYVQVGLFSAGGPIGRSAYQVVEDVYRVPGISVASGDVTGDGVPDVALGIQRLPIGTNDPDEDPPDSSTLVRVYDGAKIRDTGLLSKAVVSFTPYVGYHGRVGLAMGDIDQDGKADIVTTPDGYAQPHIKIFRGSDGSTFGDFFAFDRELFNLGAAAAVGDMTGDGKLDVVVSAGRPSVPGFLTEYRFAVYDGTTFVDQYGPPAVQKVAIALPGVLPFRTRLAVGEADGDGRPDLFFGFGPGGGPLVSVLSGQALMGEGAIRPIGFFTAPGGGAGQGVRMVAREFAPGSVSEVVFGSPVRNRDRVSFGFAPVFRLLGQPSFAITPFVRPFTLGVEVG